MGGIQGLQLLSSGDRRLSSEDFLFWADRSIYRKTHRPYIWRSLYRMIWVSLDLDWLSESSGAKTLPSTTTVTLIASVVALVATG